MSTVMNATEESLSKLSPEQKVQEIYKLEAQKKILDGQIKLLKASLPYTEIGKYEVGDRIVSVQANRRFNPALVEKALDDGDITDDQYYSICELVPVATLARKKLGDEIVDTFMQTYDNKVVIK